MSGMTVTAMNGIAAASRTAAITVRRRRFERLTWAATIPITPAMTTMEARPSSAWRFGHGQRVLYAKTAATAAMSRQRPPTAIGRSPKVICGRGRPGGGGGGAGWVASIATVDASSIEPSLPRRRHAGTAAPRSSGLEPAPVVLRPHDDPRLADDVVARDEADARHRLRLGDHAEAEARVQRLLSVVAEHEVHAPGNVDLVEVCRRAPHVRLVDRDAVHVDLVVLRPDAVARRADHTLDEVRVIGLLHADTFEHPMCDPTDEAPLRLLGGVGLGEHDHVSALWVVEVVRNLRHEHAIVHVQRVQHRFARDVEGLDQEGLDQNRQDQRHDDQAGHLAEEPQDRIASLA